jgi:hypothetical protein
MVFAFLLATILAGAQTVAPPALLYVWPNATGTGQLGQYLAFNGQNVARPGNYSIDWSISGTAPTACTFRVEGSFDGVNWYGLDTTSPNSTSCTTSNMESIAYKPVNYLRINLVTFTGAGGTIIFHYTGGRS